MSEIIDVVDINDQVITQLPRDVVHTKELMHRASHVILQNDAKQIFLQLRSPNKKQFPNLWDISAAGHVNSGENYLHCAKREILEELGLNYNIEDFLSLGKIKPSFNNGFEFIEVFLVIYNNQPIVLEPSEITTGAWFEINHIQHWIQQNPQNFSGGVDNILELLFKRK